MAPKLCATDCFLSLGFCAAYFHAHQPPFTGSSPVCGASREALLCVGRGQTVDWKKQTNKFNLKKFLKNLIKWYLWDHYFTHKEYFSVSSSSMIAAWFPQR